MASHARDDEAPTPPAKRQKVSTASDMDPRSNPYLAHHYEESNGYNNGGANSSYSGGSALSSFSRHQTTARLAKEAENGPANPFNSQPLSQQYFNILKTRRDLPVHAQR